MKTKQRKKQIALWFPYLQMQLCVTTCNGRANVSSFSPFLLSNSDVIIIAALKGNINAKQMIIVRCTNTVVLVLLD